jgi:DNA-binding CsgD family transcriptional regulator
MNQLTPQEQKIVTLVAQGLTNKEIAHRLGVSAFTVRNQVQVIIRKLELKNRIQVAYLVGQQANIEELTVRRIKKEPFDMTLLPGSGSERLAEPSPENT